MKKNLFYCMFALVAISIVFISCSKDDPTPTPTPPTPETPARDIEKEYVEGNLVVKNGGIEMLDGEIVITAIDNTKASVLLKNIVNGHAEFVMTADVSLTKAVDPSAEYLLSGSKNVSGMNVGLSGKIKNGKANIDVNVEITATEIVKTWTYNKDSEDVSDTTCNFLILDIDTYSGRMYSTVYQDSVSVDSILKEDVLPFIASTLPSFFPNLRFIFAEDGYLSIRYKNAFVPFEEEIEYPCIARYYYNPTAKLLVFDDPSLAGPVVRNGPSPIIDIQQIPFNCNITDGVLTATVDKSLVETLIPIIPSGVALQQMLSVLDLVLDPTVVEGVKLTIGDLVDLIKSDNLKELKIGGKLMPYTPPVPI